MLKYLPPRVAEEILCFDELALIDEIRLRCDGVCSLTVQGANRQLSSSCAQEEMSEAVAAICGGSVHSHEDTMRRGFVTLPGGSRAGVCGTAVSERGEVAAVYRITSINIRVARSLKNVSAQLCSYMRRYSYAKGLLIYSPPGEGKTTLLSDAAASLSSPPHLRRVALIDSRGELYRRELFEHSIADVYTGYPKAAAIEAATRTMNPQLIVCDEIGTVEEAECILSLQNTGVPLLASAHGRDVASLLRRKGIAMLHRAGVFDCYVGIRRRSGGFYLDMTERGEVEA